MNPKKAGFSTMAIHAGEKKTEAVPVAAPIYQTAPFKFRGGVIIGTSEFIKRARHTAKNLGGALSPFNSWLITRGMKTLAVRMDRHNSSAMVVAEFLEEHEKIAKVIYPGLKSHPRYDLAKKQMSGFGGMIAFMLKDAKDVPVFLDSLKLCTLTISLGDVETLIQHPATMTHPVVPRENRLKYGIADELVRLSVGLEDAEDIISDTSEIPYDISVEQEMK